MSALATGLIAPLAGVTALLQRLRAVTPELLTDSDPSDVVRPAAEDRGQEAAWLLERMVDRLVARPERDRIWLLLVALSGTLPLDEDVRATSRQLELSSVSECCIWLLETSYAASVADSAGSRVLQLVSHSVLVDVDFAAKHDLATGIQRVVRRLVPRWEREHRIELAVWTDHADALRQLDDHERDRVLRWSGPLRRAVVTTTTPVLLVPWRTCVVLPEVPGTEQCRRLASLAEHSGNRVVAIGYDCVPVVTADLLPVAEPTKFVRYLTLVKHVDVVAGISESAVREFRGFCRALPTQGLVGPRVVSCPLATEVVGAPPMVTTAAGDVPEVLVVGSHEPRKNHLAVLQAAELLWREGLVFRLRFVGGKGWSTAAFDHRLQALRRTGRPVSTERGLGDDALWAAFRRARFTVFPSLHEGYGLPVVESLALGTPVIGTGFGSVAEIAAAGGVLTVDPRDDDALAAAMRTLLTDDIALARLRDEAASRPVRTWDDYAHELWAVVETTDLVPTTPRATEGA